LLSGLTGDRRYRATEPARPDKFVDPYVGQVYESNGTVVLTEVISTGLQWLYEDAYGFAMSDPDYFDFIWNLLRYFRRIDGGYQPNPVRFFVMRTAEHFDGEIVSIPPPGRMQADPLTAY
jgi:hypothetical protein